MKKLEEIENKKLLNHRLVERGAKLVAITKGKAIMQMLRGNLEGIYSKIVMINLVRKAIKVR